MGARSQRRGHGPQYECERVVPDVVPQKQRMAEMGELGNANTECLSARLVGALGQVCRVRGAKKTWADSNSWPFIFHWTWTAQVFFTLHTLVLLMKMHSYSFYNGHLSSTEHRLSALDNPESASTAAAVRYPSQNTQVDEVEEAEEEEKNENEKNNLTQLREDLAFELVSPLGHVTYPNNLSMMNYADYILCPTLCYELEYPRTSKRNWVELFYKTLAVFGCIFLLTLISEEFIVPVLRESALRLEGPHSWSDMGLILGETISQLLFPFMITFLLCFLVIFEYILGAFAEITCFADRHFYSDWWNSSDW